MQTEITVYPGKSYPLGAVVFPDGINFSVISMHAKDVELLLFDSENSPEPARVIPLNKVEHRTSSYWHAFVSGVGSGQVYAFRADGAPEPGSRFDRSKVLLDPYGRFVTGWDNYDRKAAAQPGDNCAKALRSVAIDSSDYDWEGDKPMRRPLAESVIYEMHVGAFTSNPNAGIDPSKRGTFAGVTEKIPYLQELGVTAVELMPVQAFDEQDARDGLTNYWGYSTVGFFAPHYRYCSTRDPHQAINEFRDMVKALHRAGIEVILDVVFNHTAEGDADGPTLCFRGLDNQAYYILDPKDGSRYEDFTGCGNTFRANHPITGRLILDSLRYWVSEMHVDGFRFDLAAALSRDVFGEPLDHPPVLWNIESDPILAGSKLIAEAWDAAGLYQVGRYINLGTWYAEWNGPFRDDVRRFVKGDNGTVKSLSLRIGGSSDLYYMKPRRDPARSINFITCHDGFTLNDLVTYDRKHNELNGERNRDGSDHNHSWSCGVEGPTTNEEIDKLRERQIKNLLTILFASYGTPMLLMGDEVRRTQLGNNNAYCQNSTLSWFDWDNVRTNRSLLRFVKQLIRSARSLQQQRMSDFEILSDSPFRPHITWHGTKLAMPDWKDDSHSLAFTLYDARGREYLHVMLNAYWEPLKFDLPKRITGQWHRVIDTFLEEPDDIAGADAARPIHASHYLVHSRSSVVLLAK